LFSAGKSTHYNDVLVHSPHRRTFSDSAQSQQKQVQSAEASEHSDSAVSLAFLDFLTTV